MSHLDLLLEEDRDAPVEAKQILRRFDPWAAVALDEAAEIFLALLKLVRRSAADDRDERRLDEISREAGVSGERLIELVKAGDQSSPVSAARAIYVPYHARDIGKLLFTLCGRQFRWMGTDLLRGRVTSAIGYVRLQTESVALVHLLLGEPAKADAWYEAGLSGDGRAFYHASQKSLMTILRSLNLHEAYDWGSAHALHVRIFPVLRGHAITRTPGAKPYFWLHDHEFSAEEPTAFLEAFVRILAAQAHIIRGLRLGRPDVDTQAIADLLGPFATNVKRLSEKR